MKIGSPEHRDTFCRHFMQTYTEFDPDTLPWPDLDEAALQRLKSVPFWEEVFYTERRAGAIVAEFVKTVKDPVMKEAVALQGFEEARHAKLIRVMIQKYGIDAAERPLEDVSDNVETRFKDFGFGECMDSFLGFGVFKIAMQSQFLPKEMFAIFETLMYEETRHIVFFVNWMAYNQAQKGFVHRVLLPFTDFRYYMRALGRMVGTAKRGKDLNDGKEFSATQASVFLDGFTFRRFLEDCYSENRRRMGAFDSELLRPSFLPQLAETALGAMRLWSFRQAAACVMKWAPKIGVAVALSAGLVAVAYLVWSIGFDPIFAAVARAGFGGLALLCIFYLIVFISLAFAWQTLLPPAQRRPVREFYLARLVRDSIAEISPFSPVGGMVAAARLLVLKGMPGSYAGASVAGDATTEAMAQVVFLAFGLGWGVTQFRHAAGDGMTQAMLAVLLLAVPAIALLIFLQKKGAGFAERMAKRFFPHSGEGISLHAAIEEMYDSKRRLAASSALHLLAWIGAGVGTWIAFRLVGGEIPLLNAIALEALLCTLRSIAAPVPAAIGVQEWGYAVLAPLFGLPAEMGVAVSLLKRAREIVLGVPALIYWQSVEGRRAFAGATNG